MVLELELTIIFFFLTVSNITSKLQSSENLTLYHNLKTRTLFLMVFANLKRGIKTTKKNYNDLAIYQDHKHGLIEIKYQIITHQK